jgi:hypothetical protein
VSRCTLELAGECVVVAQGGTPEAEYLLFDPGDIELSASGPGTIREAGYRTTAGEARGRLAQAGLTRRLAEEVAAATLPFAKAFARGAAVRRIAAQLEAAEIFDGQCYDTATARYLGAWLDLPALVSAVAARLDIAQGAEPVVLFQGLHLAALLAEHPDDAPLVLNTSEVTGQRRPGERTFRRLVVHQPGVLLEALRGLRLGREPTTTETGPGRTEIVRWLRQRAQRLPASASRFAAMQAALGARDQPQRGPLAAADLWQLETRLSMGETEGVLDRVEGIERTRGRLPGTTYLRERVALLAGAEEPRAIAERVSALSTSMAEFHELQLLAAEAWSAAGDVRRARAFARDLSDNASACDALRMQAREVLETTGRATTAPEGAVPVIPKPPLAPSAGRVEDDLGLEGVTEVRRPGGLGGEDLPPSKTDKSSGRHFRPDLETAPAPEGRIALEWRDQRWPRALVLPPVSSDLSAPSARIEPVASPSGSAPPAGVGPERLESLGLPPGLQDAAPPSDERPRTPQAARLLFTYLARELGRELRVRHGVDVRTDVDGLELAQRYLFEACPQEEARSAEERREVMRHGAFLSELLARRLGARWVDLDPPDPGQWAMAVPSFSRAAEVSRIWPVGRILRYIAQRHRERDLVSYYLELEAFAR